MTISSADYVEVIREAIERVGTTQGDQVALAADLMTATLQHLVAGRWYAGAGDTLRSLNPAHPAITIAEAGPPSRMSQRALISA